jgi:hypothetical protein
MLATLYHNEACYHRKFLGNFVLMLFILFPFNGFMLLELMVMGYGLSKLSPP